MRGLAARTEVLRDPDGPVVLVRLSGEFDAHELEALRQALDGAVGPHSPTSVDLSRVTFLDVRCTTDLALRSGPRGGHLALRNPSWQAESSFKACGFGDRITAPTLGKSTYGGRSTGREPHDVLACAG